MNNHKKIKDLYSNDLESEQRSFKSMLFTDDNTGYLAGSFDSVSSSPDTANGQFAILDQKAVVYYTADGGQTWRESRLCDGSIMDLKQAGTMIFALTMKQEDAGHELYIHDRGADWIKSENFPAWGEAVAIEDDKLVAIGTRPEGAASQLVYSTDMGKIWSAPEKLQHSMFSSPVMNDGKLYFLSATYALPDHTEPLLVSYDPDRKLEETIRLPVNFDASLIGVVGRTLRLAGTENGVPTVYSLQNNQPVRILKMEEAKNFYPVGAYYTNTESWFLLNREGDVDKLLVKTSDGSNWEQVTLHNKHWAEPFFFRQDSSGNVRAWFYSGPGKIQVMQ